MATYEDMKKIVSKRAVRGINIKPPKAGGIYWGLKIRELAEENDILIMVGSMIESAIGIAAASHFASGIKNVYHEDLDSDYYFDTDAVTDESRPRFENGSRVPSTRPRLGIELQPWADRVLKGDIEIFQRA